jgi:hypothetical protein
MEDFGAKLVVGLIGQVIFWVALFTALAMLKRYISFGVSVAFAEILSKAPGEMQHKIAKWFGNGNEIVAVLEDMKKVQED